MLKCTINDDKCYPIFAPTAIQNSVKPDWSTEMDGIEYAFCTIVFYRLGAITGCEKLAAYSRQRMIRTLIDAH
jgi:hypothetical protein